MVTTETGANDRGKNSPRSSAVKNLSLRGDGHPRSPAATSAPNYGGGNGDGSVDSTLSGEDVAPMKTGSNNDDEEKSPRSGSVKNLSLRGEGHLLSTVASSAPNNVGGDGGSSADPLRSGEEMAPTTSTAH